METMCEFQGGMISVVIGFLDLDSGCRNAKDTRGRMGIMREF